MGQFQNFSQKRPSKDLVKKSLEIQIICYCQAGIGKIWYANATYLTSNEVKTTIQDNASNLLSKDELLPNYTTVLELAVKSNID